MMNDAGFQLSVRNWARVRELLIAALEGPPDARAELLRTTRDLDASLAREVESLLDAHTRSERFLDAPAADRIAALLDADDAEIDPVIGPYRIVRPIGRGGMGVVYLAHDTRLERRVALKVLPAWLAANPTAKRRLEGEARIAAGLDHPNIAIVYEIGETPDGQPFIAMAYYEGETLAERLRRDPVTVGEAVRFTAQIAHGIGAAHARGCVHCDIKPSNLIVTDADPRSREGAVVKILDFGIARHLGESSAGRGVAGTIAYMAPERTHGSPPDARADLWSIGVVLYEMLTGQLPFRPGRDGHLVDAIRAQEPDPIENLRPDVPPALDHIVRKCLRKDPEERYSQAGELLADLERLEHSRSAGSGPRRAARRDTASPRSNRLAVRAIDDASPAPGHPHIAAGLTRALISRLAKLQGLRVIAAAASQRYAGSRIAAIGLDLDVSAVLTGTVRRDGDDVQLRVELVDAVTEELIWSDEYVASGGRPDGVERRIASQVAEALHVRMRADQPGRGGVGTADQAAYEHYLKGRYYADRFDEPSAARARAEFQLALDRDPAFAEAWAGLADAYKVFDYLSLLSPGEAASRVRAAAERALALDPDLAAAHTSLATVLADHDRDWEAASRHFSRAVELDPGYATGHQLYAEYLRDFGRLDDAMAMIRRARELDPLSPVYLLVEGTIHLMARRPAEAMELFEQLAGTHPGYQAVHFYLALGCLHAGQAEAALAALDRYDPRGRIPDAIALRGGILAAIGRASDAHALLARLDELSTTRYVSPVHRGFIHLGLGDVDRALDALEQMAAERGWFVRLLKAEPSFDPLRSHPRFLRLLETVGLA